MINLNGEIVSSSAVIATNRAFLYGDAVFETLKITNNKILFFEDHYFRLMAAMRIVRMTIPMNFTMEFLENQILQLVKESKIEETARIRLTVYRNEGGYYLPLDNTVSYLIQAIPLQSTAYSIDESDYEVDLYKDFVVTKQLLSSIKTTNTIINTMASIYAHDNSLQNCLLLNNEKNVVEAINGNLFLVINSKLITPPISDGCLNGIMRKQIIEIAKKYENLEVIEASISPFDLQKADELFITNVISGIQPITKYRKKYYANILSKQLLKKLNEYILD